MKYQIFNNFTIAHFSHSRTDIESSESSSLEQRDSSQLILPTNLATSLLNYLTEICSSPLISKEWKRSIISSDDKIERDPIVCFKLFKA